MSLKKYKKDHCSVYILTLLWFANVFHFAEVGFCPVDSGQKGKVCPPRKDLSNFCLHSQNQAMPLVGGEIGGG